MPSQVRDRQAAQATRKGKQPLPEQVEEMASEQGLKDGAGLGQAEAGRRPGQGSSGVCEAGGAVGSSVGSQGKGQERVRGACSLGSWGGVRPSLWEQWGAMDGL